MYETLTTIKAALHELKVPFIITGGSLLGAVRQHSVLFCDDDIDIAILDDFEKVEQNLQALLGSRYKYSIKPWEGGDRVRPKFCSSVFIDIFAIRRYETKEDFLDVVGIKKNGEKHPQEYVENILATMTKAGERKNDARAKEFRSSAKCCSLIVVPLLVVRSALFIIRHSASHQRFAIIIIASLLVAPDAPLYRPERCRRPCSRAG